LTPISPVETRAGCPKHADTRTNTDSRDYYRSAKEHLQVKRGIPVS